MFIFGTRQIYALYPHKNLLLPNNPSSHQFSFTDGTTHWMFYSFISFLPPTLGWMKILGKEMENKKEASSKWKLKKNCWNAWKSVNWTGRKGTKHKNGLGMINAQRWNVAALSLRSFYYSPFNYIISHLFSSLNEVLPFFSFACSLDRFFFKRLHCIKFACSRKTSPFFSIYKFRNCASTSFVITQISFLLFPASALSLFRTPRVLSRLKILPVSIDSLLSKHLP